jgi:KaiC/GvpD/RAD55 family RecA-like ATPase
VNIEHSLDGSDWNLISTVETDQEGEFTLTWKTAKIGNIKIRARYMGDENYYGAESTVELEVESPATSETDLTYPILIATLAAASILAVFWKIRRGRPESKLGSQAVPARVSKAALEPLEPIRTETMGRISTGPKGLNRLLGGGLRSGYAVALTSPTCDELDLFTHEFLEAGLQANSSVLYMTTKLTGELDLAQKYPSRFYYVICNPQVVPREPRMPNVHIMRSLDSLTEINLAVAKILEEMEKTCQQNVACIDFVSDVLLQHGSVATRQWLLNFISRMKSKSVTMLAIVNPQMHSSEDLESMVGLFDGQISLWEEMTAGTVQKLIRVRRMYRERYSDKSLPISKGDLS